MGVQGSGWGWLAVKPATSKLFVLTTANQDPVRVVTPVRILLSALLIFASTSQGLHCVMHTVMHTGEVSEASRPCMHVCEQASWPCMYVRVWAVGYARVGGRLCAF